MGWCWNGFNWGGWGGVGGIGLILNLVLFAGMLGLGTTWLIRQIRRPTASRAGGDSLEIVRRRLAAGEITIAEFEQIRDRLQS